jgi:hypothetical protein
MNFLIFVGTSLPHSGQRVIPALVISAVDATGVSLAEHKTGEASIATNCKHTLARVSVAIPTQKQF